MSAVNSSSLHAELGKDWEGLERELAGAHVEYFSKSNYQTKGWIPVPIFEVSNVSGLDPDQLCELALRVAESLASAADSVSKLGIRLHLFALRGRL